VGNPLALSTKAGVAYAVTVFAIGSLLGTARVLLDDRWPLRVDQERSAGDVSGPLQCISRIVDQVAPLDALLGAVARELGLQLCEARDRAARVAQITSPGRISSIGPPQHCVHPQPAVTMSV
jgi:hypothetical protein